VEECGGIRREVESGVMRDHDAANALESDGFTRLRLDMFDSAMCQASGT
jgi:hypothetical protein